MLDTLCKRPLIEKVRYTLRVGSHTWEIDVFEGDNAGLVIAEIELRREDEAFEKPEWVGEEVTDDPRYFNSNLVANPYRTW
jgi:adenylate cyclase